MNENDRIVCNKCGCQFAPNDIKIEELEDQDLAVQFYRCPGCKSPYLILASDHEMRQLTARRRAIQIKIRVAKMKRFRESTFRKYIREDEAIKKKQDAIFPELERRGKELLSRLEGAE